LDRAQTIVISVCGVLLLIVLVIVAGHSGDTDHQVRDLESPPKHREYADSREGYRALAMKKRPPDMSVEQLDALAAKAKWLFPSMSHNTWLVIHALLEDGEYRSGHLLELAVIDLSFRARRSRSEGILQVVLFDRVRDGDDELTLILNNRTGKTISALKGTLELADQFGDVIDYVGIKVDKMPATCSVRGRWPLSERGWKVLDDCSWKKMEFVVARIIYADGTEEIFDRLPEDFDR